MTAKADTAAKGPTFKVERIAAVPAAIESRLAKMAVDGWDVVSVHSEGSDFVVVFKTTT